MDSRRSNIDDRRCRIEKQKLTPRSLKSRKASSLAVNDSSCSASRRNDCTKHGTVTVRPSHLSFISMQ